MNRKLRHTMLLAFTVISLVGCQSPVTPAADAVIDIAAIHGVSAPVYGATPVTAIAETIQYTGTVTWNGSPATFAASTVYTATITLTPKSGFTLTGVAGDFFEVEGASSVSNPADSGVVTAVFPATWGENYDSPNIGILKFVPAGRFQRDATASNISVITSPYRISTHEITREQFAAVFSTDPSDPTYSSGTTDPVQMTSWYDAIAFCNKLSITEDLTPVYEVSGVDFTTLTFPQIPTGFADPALQAVWDAATANWNADGYRLPTEMEWLWAAMGADTADPGAINTTGYLKAFAGSTGSNTIGDYAVFGYYQTETGRTDTERSNPVGSKTAGANELGLYDMSGNVFEWTWDWYGDYPTGTVTDYRGADSGTERIASGGSWGNDSSFCALAFRFHYYPPAQVQDFGFRVVRP
ncbi:MAG: SUMF1/EgtB/PvdO family nonheme iron enzyme [Spirochaetales bacterium]|nr:SUMF1/EgtB/PvdO family nonheme iron enzyme [Spirochaetales bacterium]